MRCTKGLCQFVHGFESAIQTCDWLRERLRTRLDHRDPFGFIDIIILHAALSWLTFYVMSLLSVHAFSSLLIIHFMAQLNGMGLWVVLLRAVWSLCFDFGLCVCIDFCNSVVRLWFRSWEGFAWLQHSHLLSFYFIYFRLMQNNGSPTSTRHPNFLLFVLYYNYIIFYYIIIYITLYYNLKIDKLAIVKIVSWFKKLTD